MLNKLLISIILNGIALFGVIYVIPDITYEGGIIFFIVGALVMGILNGIVRPILKLITLPLQIVTLGFSLILLNALMFYLFEVSLEILVIEGVTIAVPDIISYFLAGLVFGIINWALHLFLPKRK